MLILDFVEQTRDGRTSDINLVFIRGEFEKFVRYWTLNFFETDLMRLANGAIAVST